MNESVAIIAAVTSGIFAIASACIAWWLKRRTEELSLRRIEEKERYGEKKELYTKIFSLFEQAILCVLPARVHGSTEVLMYGRLSKENQRRIADEAGSYLSK